MIRYLQGRPMTQKFLEWDLSEEVAWALRQEAHRRLGREQPTTRLDQLVVRPVGRSRKPGWDDVRGLAQPRGWISAFPPLAWLNQDPDAKPSYDIEQEIKAGALVTRELREMDATW